MPPSIHVQSRYEDVEQRLRQHVDDAISKGVKRIQQTPDSIRLTNVENQIRSLVDNHAKLEHWITDGSAKVHTLQRECAQLHSTVSSQGQALQAVATEVGQCSASLGSVAKDVSGLKEGLASHLDAYFAKQHEAMLAKRQRHH